MAPLECGGSFSHFAEKSAIVGRTSNERIHPMKLGLINSAWAQSGRDTAYGIRQTKDIGFDTIDIFADPLDTGVKERRLINFNPSVQRFHMERCRKYLDFVLELGAKNLLLVLGEYIWERQVIPPAEQWQT